MLINLREELKIEDIPFSHLFPFIFHFKSNKKKQTSLIRQTYSWNKDGLKLFLFWEYGPYFLAQDCIGAPNYSI